MTFSENLWHNLLQDDLVRMTAVETDLIIDVQVTVRGF